MYDLKLHKDIAPSLIKFIAEHPFATLTGGIPEQFPVATQIPLIAENRNGHLYLKGHVMRNTDHFKVFKANPKVLAVFTGPHCYVSSNWYSNPLVGSTWNYMSVHVKGELNELPLNKLPKLLQELTLKFENDPSKTTNHFENLPSAYLEKVFPLLAGFEIKVEQMDHVFKLSQDRDEKSYKNIIRHLEQIGGNSEQIAKEMKERKNHLFPTTQSTAN